MRDVAQADNLSAVVIWMSVIAFMFGVILCALMVVFMRQFDMLRRRVDELEDEVQDLKEGTYADA